ncbi:MAG: hypothetical protein V3U16_05655 [Candidatus Neomarinimicrobiota bacterium]
MKNIPILISSTLILAVSCTKIQEPPIHPSDWTERGSDNFHVTKIVSAGIGSCAECHNDDYTDEFESSSGITCYPCHAEGTSPHPSSWASPSESDDFHGNVIRERGNSSCAQCHSGPEDDFEGGTSGISCYQCHGGGPSGHPAFNIWVGSKDNDAFHGNIVLSEGLSVCQVCHGLDLRGGISNLSCFTCH